MEALKILNNLGAIQEIKSLGGEIFLVGGIVRDHFLGKKSKDIDIIVRLLDEDTIKNILLKHGNLASEDEDGKTGASFGVFKFFPNEVRLDEPIDIALPRTERLMTDKEFSQAVKEGKLKAHNRHKAFVVTSDPTLSIIEDLSRRDFTINSMAVSLDGELIDPFNGHDDLSKMRLKATSDKAFSDDPLRMMRAVQFASRLGFTIDNGTWDLILSNKKDILHITGERILIELDKIFFKKGDMKLASEILIESGLADVLFPNMIRLPKVFNKCKTREDFFFCLLGNGNDFKSKIKGDTDSAKGIDAIKLVADSIISESKNLSDLLNTPKASMRMIISKAIGKSETVIDSGIVNYFSEISSIVDEFKSGLLPKNAKELVVDGNEIQEFGFVKVEIGEAQRAMIERIFADKLNNTREDLISFLTKRAKEVV